MRALLAAGEGERAIPALERLCAAAREQPRAWWLLGLARHDVQRHEKAIAAMTHADRLAPGGRAALALAQLRYETGRPAADAFAALARRAPQDEAVIRGLANALAAEGAPDEAERVLADATRARPGWITGLSLLATLRQTRGRADYDAGFAAAVRATPGDTAVRLAWFHLLAKAKRWDDARRVLHEARAAFGDTPVLAVAALYVASEAGESDDPALLDALPPSPDPGTGVLRVRHALRTGDPTRAAQVAEAFVATPGAPLFWPYLSLAWRLTGDPRGPWLDRSETVRTVDLGLTGDEIATLADTLRALHTARAPYIDQSVRGGTQTDRPLLFRHDPIIARVRAAIEAAVERYIVALPPREAGHPLLAPPRDRVRFAGSWSVRLSAQGYHASHTHPAGWISSALYVALPDAPGPAPAGWLELGTPPPELGLPLGAQARVRPRVGELTLFPSTTWHGTAPFVDGERLTIAFDVARPR